jgi:hypothetical protein
VAPTSSPPDAPSVAQTTRFDLCETSKLWAFVVPAIVLILWAVNVFSHRYIPRTYYPNRPLFLAETGRHLVPEPREQFRYLAAITLVPLLLILTASWFKSREFKGWVWWLGLAARVALAVEISDLVWLQETRISPYLRNVDPSWYFTGAALLASAWCFGRQRTSTGFWRKFGAVLLGTLPVLIAIGFTVVQLLPSVQFAGQPGLCLYSSYHIAYQYSEFAAVLHGQTPLVDFFPQYQQLLGYPLAPIFSWIGMNVFHFSLVMAGLSLCLLMMMFDVLRRTTGSTWYALALYLPFLGVAFLQLDTDERPWHQHINAFTYFAVGPIRYVGPFLSLWGLSVYLSNPTRPRFFLASVLAGFGALNNLDFGLCAMGGVFLAIVLTDGPGTVPPFRRIMQLGLRFLPGILVPAVLMCIISLVRTGEIPRLDKVFQFQRAFAVNGFNMLPMPRFGLHTVVYMTYVACIARGVFGKTLDRQRRGLLIMSGISGFGVLMYYVGRSHPHTLVMGFAMWGFALMLLTWTSWEEWLYRYRTSDWRAWTAPVTLLLTIAYMVVATEVGHTPNVGAQLMRLQLKPDVDPTDLRQPMLELVRQYAKPGEAVMIVHPFYAHAVADEAGVRNVFPFSGGDTLLLRRQLDMVIERARKNQVRWLIESERGVRNPLVRVFFFSNDERRALGATLQESRAGVLVWKLDLPPK